MNRINAFLFLFLIFIAKKAVGQYSISSGLVNRTVLIESMNGSSGTGFFFYYSNQTYLITAKHVLYDMQTNTLLDSVILAEYYPEDVTKSKQNYLRMDLNKLSRDRNVKYSKDGDVAIIKLSKSENINRLNEGAILNEDLPLNAIVVSQVGCYDSAVLGDDVYIVGYPKSLGLSEAYQYDFNRPLLRKGALAGKSQKNNTLVVDCPSYPGNSGGPVYEVSYSGDIKLIGIVVSFIPLVERELNLIYKTTNSHFVNSGYSVVEPVDKVIKLINLF